MSKDLNFKLLNKKVIIDEPWLKVSSNDYQLPDENTLKDYYVVEEKNGVTIIALTSENKILIVEQFRPPVETITLDFPGGLIEKGDTDPLLRAKHELLEETGYESNNWVDIGYFYPAPHRLHNTQRCYLALDIEKVSEQKLDDSEFVTYKLVTIEELEDMIKNNEFLCGYCITAYLKAKLHLGLK